MNEQEKRDLEVATIMQSLINMGAEKRKMLFGTTLTVEIFATFTLSYIRHQLGRELTRYICISDVIKLIDDVQEDAERQGRNDYHAVMKDFKHRLMEAAV